HSVTEFGRFFDFKVMTLFPFDRSLFATSIMTDEEIRWVNDYHAMVAERLCPLLSADEAAWMKEKTAPIAK
ncbi:MAG: M24 family metallopeptidase C-terminal domain-containing protein, partial [Muribaculaceae bacterium]|nr:M24 family metallopeptidase C-terminal domain-containing protein [Muribaculaceae bacterium]